MMYMMEFLRDCPTLEKAVPQASEVRLIVGTGEVVVGIFCVIFLIYSNSFLMKRRQKEIDFIIFWAWKRPYRKSDVSGNNYDFTDLHDSRNRAWNPWQ